VDASAEGNYDRIDSVVDAFEWKLAPPRLVSQHQSPRQQSSGYCPHCESRRRLVRDQLELEGMHLVLTFVTFALWLVVYAIFIADPPYRCHECGTIVEPREERS
jgi:DNA-directed RNA polymerase subunit RPC12/RpoP